MRHRQIVGVDDEKLGVGGVAEAHIQGLIDTRASQAGGNECGAEPGDVTRLHGSAPEWIGGLDCEPAPKVAEEPSRREDSHARSLAPPVVRPAMSALESSPR